MNWSAVQKLCNSKLVVGVPIHRGPVHIPDCDSETYIVVCLHALIFLNQNESDFRFCLSPKCCNPIHIFVCICITRIPNKTSPVNTF